MRWMIFSLQGSPCFSYDHILSGQFSFQLLFLVIIYLLQFFHLICCWHSSFQICSSKYVVVLEIIFSCSIRFGENLFVVFFIHFVYYERHSVSDLRFTSSFTIFLSSSCCFSYFWSDWVNMTWIVFFKYILTLMMFFLW